MATRATIGATSTAAVVLSSATSKTGGTAACLAIEDGFSDPNDGLSVVVYDFKNGLGCGYHFDSDDGECKVRISSGLDNKEQNLW